MTPSTPPTETPRTDSNESLDDEGVRIVDPDFARELERELTLCLAKNTEYQADVIRIADRLRAAEVLLSRCCDEGLLPLEGIQQFLKEKL